MLELIRLKAAASDELIRTIVVHRDGRLWESEREGILRAVDRLRTEGVIASNATVAILEISKTSPVSLRLFDVDDATASNPNVLNPQVGGYLLGHDNDAYVCTTGRAFPGRARSTRCTCGSSRDRCPWSAAWRTCIH